MALVFCEVDENGKQVFPWSHYTTCFYTGLPFPKKNKVSVSNWKRTRKTQEHLLPQCLLPKEIQHQVRYVNEVAAMHSINCLVGNAPLKVKFALRDYLKTCIVYPKMSVGQKAVAYQALAKEFLSRFRFYQGEPIRQNPWNYRGVKDEEERKVHFAAYCDLLSVEELLLLERNMK